MKIVRGQQRKSNSQPPGWAQRFIEWYCKPGLSEDLIGDLNEYFERNVEKVGVRRARIIYVIDALKFLRTYTVRPLKFVNVLINTIMIGSYIKTSGRNVMRNKLFSSINIVGLAISMSVGLLMIAFVHDLLSYDKFHENGDRIYRVITRPGGNERYGNQFASTSVRAAHLVREQIPSVEQSVLMRVGFGGDATVGESVLPVHGFWAEPSFFTVFTFAFVSGDPATALVKPNTVVITEQTAKKLFGDQEALGKTIRFDTTEFEVTGVMKDIPKTSHMQFEALGSFVTCEQQASNDERFLSWGSTWSNYFYMVLPETADIAQVQSQLDAMCFEENAVSNADNQRSLELQQMGDIVLGKSLANPIGPTIPVLVIWIVSALGLVVILSAAFNYTNLSIARSMRRFKEIGLRKAIGARRAQVRQQFLFEAIIISLLALAVSFAIFLFLRGQLLMLAPELQTLVTLDLTPTMIIAFVVFSIAVGVMAGFMPALFFAKINVIHALKDASAVKMFRHLNMRRALVVFQYTLTLMFITATIISYTQYKTFLVFDLGFDTENILNIELQGNKADNLVKELGELPEVEDISRSIIVSSVGTMWGGQATHKNDSSRIYYNIVDENYLTLHEYQFVAGQNFVARPATREATSEVVVNEKIVRDLNIGGSDPARAIGEPLILDGRPLTIVGVVKDFHYGKVDQPIEPVAFTFWTNETDGWVNVKVRSDDPIALRGKVESIWKKIDTVHPINASFYTEAIERAYSEFSVMITIIGFLSFLAISIASMGLFGMVVFTTETKLKEISIRKVMGASSGNLVLLLSRGFMILLGSSALIALPLTYLLFENVILVTFPFHNPVSFIELITGSLVVMAIAFVMIGTQTLKATRANPSEVLKNE